MLPSEASDVSDPEAMAAARNRLLEQLGKAGRCRHNTRNMGINGWRPSKTFFLCKLIGQASVKLYSLQSLSVKRRCKTYGNVEAARRTACTALLIEIFQPIHNFSNRLEFLNPDRRTELSFTDGWLSCWRYLSV